MSLPRIAIIGRPNVGKSSLTNMIASRRVSIVDPTPGVTRDRVSSTVMLEGEDPRTPPMRVELTDTGGYGVYTAEGRKIDEAGFDLSALTDDIEKQIAAAVNNADLVLFVIDAQAGVTPQDEHVAKLLREGGLAALDDTRGEGEHARAGQGPRVVVVANKVDGPRWEMHGLEASSLGFGEPLLVSAKNNFRRRELVEKLYAMARELEAARAKAEAEQSRAGGEEPGEPEVSDRPAEMMLAIVGKRNAGKSTLVNTLAGEQRVIVSEIPGTTRDAIDVRFEMDGRSFVAIDTAGLRRKKSFQDRIEWYALDRLKAAVDRCDVALFLIDATVGISQVDEQIGHMVVESYKPVVIVVNKWDLAKDRFVSTGRKSKRGEKVTPEMYEQYIRNQLGGLAWAPIAFISGQAGTNIRETIDLAFDLFQQAHERATTGRLNRLLRDIIEKRGPSNKLGTFAKIYYVSQIRTAPPTIVCVVNRPELFTPNYQRFLLNRFREELPFSEVPIRLLIRARRKGAKGEMEQFELAEVEAEALAGDQAGQESGGLLAAEDYFDEPLPGEPKPARQRVISADGEEAVEVGGDDSIDEMDEELEDEPGQTPSRASAAGTAARKLASKSMSRPAGRPAGKGAATRGAAKGAARAATGARPSARGSARGRTPRAGTPRDVGVKGRGKRPAPSRRAPKRRK